MKGFLRFFLIRPIEKLMVCRRPNRTSYRKVILSEVCGDDDEARVNLVSIYAVVVGRQTFHKQ